MEKKIDKFHPSSKLEGVPVHHVLEIKALEYFLVGCSTVMMVMGLGLLFLNHETGVPIMAAIMMLTGIGVWVYLWVLSIRTRQKQNEVATANEQHLKSENKKIKIELARAVNALDELENQNLYFDQILEISESLTEMLDLKSTISNIIEMAITQTGADTGSLITLNGSREVTGAIFPNRDLRPDIIIDLANQVLTHGIAGWVVKHQQAAIVFDAEEDERWMKMPDAPYLDRSALSVPIFRQKILVGVLTLIHNAPNHFENRDLTLLGHLSNQIAIALTNAQIFDEQRAMIERQTALNEVLKGISQQGDPLLTAQKTTDTVVHLTGWSLCAILIPSVDRHRLNAQAISPAGFYNINYIPIDVDHPIGRSMVERGLYLENNLASGQSTVFENLPARSELFVPLVLGTQTLGVMYVADAAAYRFLHEDVQLARSIAEASTLTIANANLVRALSDQTGRLNAVIEANRDGVVMIGPDFRILVINQVALNLLACTGEPHDWLGQPISDLCASLEGRADDLVNSIEIELDHLTTTSVRSANIEFVVGRRILEVNYLPIIAQKLPIGRVIVLRDVTDQRLAEQMRREITHTMVHDLRNPLHIISSGLSVFSSYIEEDLKENADKRQLMGIIDNNTHKLLKLVNGILDISRLESNKLPTHPEPFNLETEILEAKLAIEPLCLEKHVTVSMVYSPHTNLVVTDRELFGRIMQNILDNAVKFTRAGTEIRITTRLSPQKDKVELSITDQGPGIPEYLEERLFDKFQTGDHEKSGSGLGLAFCKMALEAQDERIWIAESTPQGTTITMTLTPYLPPEN